MVNFVDLQTNSHAYGGDEWRKVSISYTDKQPKVCHLLGNLPHQTEFRRDELVAFAENVLEVFGDVEKSCGHCGAGPPDAEGELPHFRDCQEA